jgi:hypothetical protein
VAFAFLKDLPAQVAANFPDLTPFHAVLVTKKKYYEGDIVRDTYLPTCLPTCTLVRIQATVYQLPNTLAIDSYELRLQELGRDE